MRKTMLIGICLMILFNACGDPSKPDGYGYSTIQYSESTESQCPYCFGMGCVPSYYGAIICSNCSGKGIITNISFRGKQVKTLEKNKKCPTKSTTFECIDEHNNGIISSTDKCIHCGHLYYVHD